MSRALALQALLITMLAANAWWLVFGSWIGPPDSLPAGHPMVGGWISGGLSVAGGLATAGLGVAALAGRFSAIQAMLLS